MSFSHHRTESLRMQKNNFFFNLEIKKKKTNSTKFEDANLKAAGLLAQEGPGHMSKLPWGEIL